MPTISPRRVFPTPSLVIGVAVFLLAACGGGNSSSDPAPAAPPPPSPISPATYEGVAREFGTVLKVSMAPLSSVSASTLGSAGAGSASAPLTPEIRSLVRAISARELLRPTLVAGSAVSLPCTVSGSLSLTWTDADRNLLFSLGDSITLEAQSCKWSSESAALVGRFSFQVLALDLGVSNGSMTLRGFDFQLSLNGFGFSGGANISGSARVRAQDLNGAMPTERITYSNVTVSIPGQASTVNNLDLLMRTPVGRTEREINGTYARPDVLTLQQISAFVEEGTPYPTAGQLRIKDAQNASVLLKARSDQQVEVAYFPAGATEPTAVKIMSWSELLGG